MFFPIGFLCGLSKVSWKATKYIPFIRDLHIRILPPYEPEFSLGNNLLNSGNYKAAEIKFRLASQLLPQEAESYANLALCLFLLGQKDDAIMEIDKAIELKPDDDLLIHTKKQFQIGTIKRIVCQHGKVRKK
ncbi:MAG: tetratricopeptide repeat protein [Desulfomonilia bacterium]